MNAIQYLRKEHDNARMHFREFERCGGNDYDTMKRHVEEAMQATERNVMAEERVLFPALQGKANAEQETMVRHLKEEHQTAAQMMEQIKRMSPQSETYEHMVKQLSDTLEEHFGEEETRVFPQVEQILGNDLDRLGDQMQSMGRSKAA